MVSNHTARQPRGERASGLPGGESEGPPRAAPVKAASAAPQTLRAVALTTQSEGAHTKQLQFKHAKFYVLYVLPGIEWFFKTHQ